MFCFLHLSCLSACLHIFGPWDLSVECRGLGTVFLNLVIPLKHLTSDCMLPSHSSPPAAAAGEENWRHKKEKITGWDKDNLLETATNKKVNRKSNTKSVQKQMIHMQFFRKRNPAPHSMANPKEQDSDPLCPFHRARGCTG